MVGFEGEIQLFLVVFFLHSSLIILRHYLRLTWHFKCLWVHHAVVTFVFYNILIFKFFFIAFDFGDFVENVPFEYHVINVC